MSYGCRWIYFFGHHCIYIYIYIAYVSFLAHKLEKALFREKAIVLLYETEVTDDLL